jgi:hypothetical protein
VELEEEQSFLEELVEICKLVTHEDKEWVLAQQGHDYRWYLTESMPADLQEQVDQYKKKVRPEYFTIIRSPVSRTQESYPSSESSRATPHYNTLPVREDESGRVSVDNSSGSREGLESLGQISVLKEKARRWKEVKQLLKFKVDELSRELQESKSLLSLSSLTHGEDQSAAGAMMKKSALELAMKLPPL